MFSVYLYSGKHILLYFYLYLRLEFCVCIYSMLDANFLEGIQALTGSDQLELFYTELVEMHINILLLLQTCLVYDPTTRMDILQDKVALGGVISLLRIYSDGMNREPSTCYIFSAKQNPVFIRYKTMTIIMYIFI